MNTSQGFLFGLVSVSMSSESHDISVYMVVANDSRHCSYTVRGGFPWESPTLCRVLLGNPWKASGLLLWATFNALWSTSGYSGLLFWAIWLARFLMQYAYIFRDTYIHKSIYINIQIYIYRFVSILCFFFWRGSRASLRRKLEGSSGTC